MSRFVIQTHLDEWCQKQPDLLAIYLFGSQAEGRARVNSDIDLALVVDPDLSRAPIWRREDTWADQLSRLLAPDGPVDVVVLNLAPLEVSFQVLAHGKVLWTRDTTALADFESYIRRRYWDFAPYLYQYRRHLRQRIKGRWYATQRAEYSAALEQTRAVHRRVKAAAKAKL